MHIDVYTDGSATTADKPGGYGYVITTDGNKHSEGSGHMPLASNNDAELQAAIEGLKAARLLVETYKASITLVSDSQIILGWASGKYAFRQQDKIEKYKEFQLLINLMHVKTRWVEGHTGDEHNERCDKLANAARKLIDPPLPAGNNTVKFASIPYDPEIKKEETSKTEPVDIASNFGQNFLLYVKENLRLYVHYKGKIKEINLETNTIVDYNEYA